MEPGTWAWAKKTQSGDSQVAEKEGPEDKRMVVLCAAPLTSSQILWGLLLVGLARQTWWGAAQEACVALWRQTASDITPFLAR